MNRRFLTHTAVAFAMGIFLYHTKIPLLFSLAGMCIGWMYLAHRQRIPRLQGFLLVLIWCIGCVSGYSHIYVQAQNRAVCDEVLAQQNQVSLQGIIYKKEIKNEQYRAYLKNVIFQSNQRRYHTNQILLYLKNDEYLIGQTIVVTGKIEQFDTAANEGGYDESLYYRSQKIDYRMTADKVTGCYGKGSYLAEQLYGFRSRLLEHYKKIASDKTQAILSVMLLGEKTLLEQDVKEKYQKAGLSHVLVISGLHISMIGAGMFGCLRRCGGGFTFSAAVSAIVLGAYVVMTGISMSAVRAYVMFLILMLGKCIGRSYDRITALSAAVLLLLADNPFLLENSGFQFSVTAILAVVLAGRESSGWRVGVMIQCMTLPLVACYYYEVPLFAVFANLILLPCVSLLVADGFLCGMLAFLCVPAAHLLVLPVELLCMVFESVCGLICQMPMHMLLTGHPSRWQVIFCYLFVLLIVWRRKKSGEQRTEQMTGNDKAKADCEREDLQEKCNLLRKNRIADIGKDILILSVCYLILSIHLPEVTQIDVLDIGQGDAVSIRLATGHQLFVDGGSTDEYAVGTYKIEPYLKYHGVRAVDYWFVTHADTDHVSGLIELLETDYPVHNLVMSAYAVENDNYKTMVELAAKRQIPIIYMKQGTKLRIGTATIECIAPAGTGVREDINARSLVLLVQEGDFDGLITGDITSVEEELLQKQVNLSQLEWYKAAHHGSKYSNSASWLTQLSPYISTISYGAGNRYGHPGAEAVRNMRGERGMIFQTAADGQINLRLQEKYVEVRKYRNKLDVWRCPMIE